MAAAGTRVGTGYVEIQPDFSRFQEKLGRQLSESLAPKLREAGSRAGREMAKGVDQGGFARALAPLRRRFERFGDEAGKAIADRIGKKAQPAANDMFGLADAVGEVERRTKKASSASQSLETDMFGVGRAAKSSGRSLLSARAALRDWHRQARAGSDGTDRFRNGLRGLGAELRRSSREARAAGGGFGGINGGMARVNRSFSFFRNLLRTLKWPALIAGLGLTAQGLSALAAGAVAATSALGPLAGALVALPAAALAGAQAFGALKLATAGVGDALKAALDAQVEGGGQAVDVMDSQKEATERVADAKGNLVSTEKQAIFAAEDFRRAHEEARRELEDMRFAADEADESIESAAIGLRRAKEELTRTLGDPGASALDVREAELSVEQAENDLRRVRAEASRTRKDYRDAQKAGVDGMPEVVAAKRAEADAARAVKDAERDVKRAIDDGKAAMAEQGAAASTLHDKMSQLPPAAQAFVRVLVGLKPRLDALRATAASGFFPGATKGLRGLLGNFSEVRTLVGETSEVFGRLAERAGKKLGSEVWGKDLLRIGRVNTKVLDRMGDAGLDLADAFRHILVAAGPFLKWMSKGIVELSEWIKGEAEAGRESGRLADFFDRTRQTMELLGPILKGVGGALLNIGEAARPLGNEILKALGGSAEGWRKWTDSVAGKNDLKQYFAEAKPAIFEMGKLIGAAGKAFFELGKQRGVAHLLSLVRTELIPALTDVTGVVTGWASDFLKEFGKLRGEGVSTFDAFLRTLANHAGRAGWAIAKALVGAFIHAGIWGKLAISTFLISKFGGFKALREWGFEAGAQFGKSLFKSAAKWIAGTETGASLLGWFQGVFGKGGRFGKAAGTAGVQIGKIFGRGMALGAVAGLVLFAPTIRDAIDKYIKDPVNDALGDVLGDGFKGILAKAQDLIDPANLGPVPTALGLDVKGFVKGKIGDLSGTIVGADKAEARVRKFGDAVGREADRARTNFRKNLDLLPGIAERNARGINRQMLPRLDELASQGGRKSEAFADRVSGPFADLGTNVGSAIQTIIGNTKRALESLGVKGALKQFAIKHPNFVYGTKASTNTQEKQQGGFIVPGAGSGDKFKTMLPAGSFILNREATAAFGFQKGGMMPVALEPKERAFVPREVKAMGGPSVLEAMNREIPRRQKGGSLGTAPMLTGPAGALRETGRAAIEKVQAAAKEFLASKRGAFGTAGLLSGSGNVESVFAKVAKRLSRSKIASLALGMAGFAESGMRDLGYGDSTSEGPLQLLASTAASMGIDPHDEGAVSSAFLLRGFFGRGGANALAAQGLPAHLVAQSVQGSAFSDGSNYLTQEGPAKAWMRRFGLKVGGLVKRFGSGGMVDPSWDPGSETIAGSIAQLVGAYAKRYDVDITAGYDPGGGHDSPGHNVSGTATDVVPRSGSWDGSFAKGLEVLVSQGFEVLYDGSHGTIAEENHGRGNHAHIEWVGNGTAADARQRLRDALGGDALAGVPGGGFTPAERSAAEAKRRKGSYEDQIKELRQRVANTKSAPAKASALWRLLSTWGRVGIFDKDERAHILEGVQKAASKAEVKNSLPILSNLAQYANKAGKVTGQEPENAESFMAAIQAARGRGQKERARTVTKQQKKRQARRNKTLAKVAAAAEFQGIVDRLSGLRRETDTADERAGQLVTLEPENLTDEYVGREGSAYGSVLDNLGSWRNTLLGAQDTATQQIQRFRWQIAEIQNWRVPGVPEFMRVFNKMKFRLPTLREAITNATSMRDETWAGELDEVQGYFGGRSIIDQLPTEAVAGGFGGRIFDIQTAIGELGLKAKGEGSEEGDSERTSLLEQLLREANQRTTTSDAQKVALEGWDKLRQGIKGNFNFMRGGSIMPPFGGIAHTGAIVPGPAGAERTMVLEAGERIRTPEQEIELATAIRGIGGDGVTVNVNGDIVQEPGDPRPAIEVRDSSGNRIKEVQSTPGTGRRHPGAFRTRP
jgi:hypothetical protein